MEEIAPPPTEVSPDLTELSLDELASVRVSTISRRSEPRAHARAAVSVITSEDLQQMGVTSLADSLREVPGVTVARADSSGWAMGIRGFTSRLARAQLVLIDGRSVYDPLFAGTYWEVQDTVLEDVDKIEVVRGPGGTLWGANAVNGIVSVVTRPASATRGGLVSLGGGNEEQFGTLRYGGGLGRKGAFRAYAKAFGRDASWHPDGSEYDNWHMVQGGFRTDFELAPEQHLTVQGDLYTGREGQRANVTTYTPPFLTPVDADARLSGGNVLARWERKGLRLQTYFDRSDRQETRFGEVRDTLDFDAQHQVGRFGRHDLVWGIGYRRSAGDSRGTETVSVRPPYRADDLYTGFAQDDVSLANDRLRVVGGAKLEHNAYTGFEVQPSVRALWIFSPRHSAWVAATRAVRTPSRIEQDIDVTLATSPTDPVFLRWFGNPAFISETLRSLELGYRAEVGSRVSVDVASFYNWHEQLLGLDPRGLTLEPGRVILEVQTSNALEGTSAGLETSVTFRASPRLRFRADYAYLDMALERQPGSPSLTDGVEVEGSSPRHQTRLVGLFNPTPSLDVSAGFRWVDGLPAQGVPSYAELDARAAWRVSSTVELAVVGQNLLHTRHPEFVGDAPTPSEMERAVLATFRYRW